MAQITTTAGSTGQAGSTNAELINELLTPMLAVAEFDNALEQELFEPVSAQKAKTMQWNRMERLKVGPTVSQLTDGVAPQPVPLTINSVTATMEEYGNGVYISTLALYTSRNDLLREAIEKLGYNVKEVRDRLLYAIADAATNVFRIADAADDDALALTHVLSFGEVSEVQSILRTAGAPRWPDGTYHLVSHSTQYANLQTDTNWLNASQYRYAEDIRRGVVNMILGVTVTDTNSNSFTTTKSTTTGNSDAIRSFFIAGRGFAKVVDLRATKMHIQRPGTGSDWMERRAQVGWTATFKGGITDQTFGRRGRASSKDAKAA